MATPVHVPGRAPVVTRIGNISSDSFDIRVQRVDGVTDELTGIQVQYVVAEEGVYTEAEHGIEMEAVRFSSTITDHKGNWKGESSFYSNSYTSPVVLGQVMSYNQSEFSVFWTSGSSRTNPPSATDFKVGKHVGEDPNTTRIDETLGYLVIEAGSGTVGGLEYSAAIGTDIVRGTQHPVTQYSISGLSNISSIILSQVAMDGGDGGWAVLSGPNPINGTTIDLAIEEDLLRDRERWHTTEQVAYLAFNASNANPTANDDSATTLEDTSVTISVLDNDSDANSDPLSINSFTQGTSGTVTDNGDGSLTYTPNGNYNGSDAFNYTVSDGNGGTDTATVNVTITPENDPPVAANDSASTDQDTPVVVSPLTNDSDVDGDTLSISSFTQATNGTVTDNGGGILTYTPNSGYVGTDSFTYTVSDGNGETDTATVNLTVLEVNQPPIANNDSATTNEDTAVNISSLANDTDSNGDTLSIASFTQGANGTVTNNGDGTLTYAPNANFSGSDSFSYTISDGRGGSDTATVNVTISPVNDDPAANDDTATVNEDDTVIITVLNNDNDIDGDSVSIDSFGQGSNGTVTDNGDGSLTYTPNGNYNGSDAFNYTVSDGNGGTDTASVNVTISPVNDDPTANDDTATVNEDDTVIITVLNNDNDIDGDSVSIDSFGQGSNGTVTDNGDGSLTYTPNGNYNGSDTFNYTVSDGNGGTDTATVDVTITPENDPPVAADDSANTDQDTPVAVSPLVNDSDVDGNTLSISSFTQATNGIVTDNGDDTLLYTPNSGYVGTDSFTYTVSDNNGATDTATVSVTVNPVVASGPKLESGIVSNVGTDDWTTVTLTTSYTSMVVVATLVLPDGTAPLVTRIDNVAANSFDLRVQRADGLTGTISGVDVHYIAVEEGIYTQADDGITMEAVKFTSTVTDGRTSWIGGESRTYNNSYSSPVVLGQVMSFNDSNFSVFWALGRNRGSVPDSSNLNVGKHVGEDQNFARANETIGYVVIESGTGTINGFEYSAAVGSDTVRGTNNGSYTYDINGLSSPNTVTLSSAGMDGRDGSWPVLLAPTPLSGATINLAVDEDLLRDGERRHTTEQVAYFAVSTPVSTVASSLDTNLLSEPSLISDVAIRVDRVLGILDEAASDTEVENGLARHWDLQLADIFSSISSLFDDDQQLTNSDASEAGFSEAAETALSEIRSWLLGDGPLPSNVDDIFADYI